MIQKVALVGPVTKFGKSILKSLCNSGNFEVSALSYTTHKKPHIKIPESIQAKVKLVPINEEAPSSDNWAKVLEGFDALVVSTEGSEHFPQSSMVEGAAKAGIKRFIPGDYVSSPKIDANNISKWSRQKLEARQALEEFSAKSSSSDFSWSRLTVGNFYEFGHMNNFSEFEVEKRLMIVMDDGNIRSSYTTANRVGESVAKILMNPDLNKNAVVPVRSFAATQLEILQSLQRLYNDETWKALYFNSDEFMTKKTEEANDGNTLSAWLLDRTLGLIDSSMAGPVPEAMTQLGLEDEDIDEAGKLVLSEASETSERVRKSNRKSLQKWWADKTVKSKVEEVQASPA